MIYYKEGVFQIAKFVFRQVFLHKNTITIDAFDPVNYKTPVLFDSSNYYGGDLVTFGVGSATTDSSEIFVDTSDSVGLCNYNANSEISSIEIPNYILEDISGLITVTEPNPFVIVWKTDNTAG